MAAIAKPAPGGPGSDDVSNGSSARMPPLRETGSSVSVVIVTFESESTIAACLDALAASRGIELETVVVDNGSSDGSADLIERRYPRVRLFREPKNLGFAGGAIAGARAARGEILILLNPDTVVEPDCIRELAATLRSDERIGLVGAKILEPDGKTIQHAGGAFRANALSEHIGRGEPDDGRFDELKDVDYVTGAALAVRRSTLRRHGFFDPGYFPAYYEEAELAVRYRKAGLRVVYAPNARLVHVEAASTGKFSDRFLRAFHRNRLRFVLKNESLGGLVFRFAPAEARWILRSLPAGSGPALLHGYLRNLAALPEILWRRFRGEAFDG